MKFSQNNDSFLLNECLVPHRISGLHIKTTVITYHARIITPWYKSVGLG